MKKSSNKKLIISIDEAFVATPVSLIKEKLKNISFKSPNISNEASNYIRVGSVYFKKLLIKNAHGETETMLNPCSISEIRKENSNPKTFFEQIEKFDAFCNIPDHTNNYKRIIQLIIDGVNSRLYNRYNPLNHKIEKGEWSNIERFLKHIFNCKNIAGENLYNFGLDYIQLLYAVPMQRLPILCFTSDKRGTGKSTFLELLHLIFQDNCAILDNETFSGKNTSHFIDKLVIGLDEGYISMKNKLMKNRIMELSASRKALIKEKYYHDIEIDYFGKLVLCSNDEKNFSLLDYAHNSLVVIKTTVVKNEDCNLLEKMKNEIGHFIYFLLNRKLHYQGDLSRYWFDINVYLTKAANP